MSPPQPPKRIGSLSTTIIEGDANSNENPPSVQSLLLSQQQGQQQPQQPRTERLLGNGSRGQCNHNANSNSSTSSRSDHSDWMSSEENHYNKNYSDCDDENGNENDKGHVAVLLLPSPSLQEQRTLEEREANSKFTTTRTVNTSTLIWNRQQQQLISNTLYDVTPSLLKLQIASDLLLSCSPSQ
jgi:hypothetical protein